MTTAHDKLVELVRRAERDYAYMQTCKQSFDHISRKTLAARARLQALQEALALVEADLLQQAEEAV